MAVSDNFNRADSGTLGANWTDTTGETGLAIVSNRARPLGGATQYNSARYTAVSFNANHTSEGSIHINGGQIGGLTARHESGGDYYFLDCRPALDGSRIFKNIGGTRTVLRAFVTAALDGHTEKIEATGTTLRWYEDGVQIETDLTDASLSAGGPGIFSRNDNTLDIDNWQGTGEITASASIDVVMPVYMIGRGKSGVVPSGFTPPNR